MIILERYGIDIFSGRQSQALDCFRDFKNMIENERGTKIKVLRSDNGLEYIP